MVDLYLTGIHPRSEDLVAATRGLDRGRTSEEEVEAVRRRDAEDLIRLQRKQGCTHLLDGLLSWQDLFRPLVETWGGLEAGPLTRWYDNNTFFRMPLVTGPIEAKPLPETYLRTDLLPEKAAWKAVLPGPYTFLDNAEDHHYGNRNEVLAGLAAGLAAVVGNLAKRGVRQVQFQEPSLAVRPPDEEGWEVLRDAYRAFRADDVEVAVHLSFGPAAPHLTELGTLPVDIIGVDLYEEDFQALGNAELDRTVALGCVDARNSLREDPDELAALAVELGEAMGAKALILCPNAGLEFLPRAVADEKVRILGMAGAKLKEGA